MRVRTASLLLSAGLLMLSCNGIFDGIYDDFSNVGEVQSGFVSQDADGKGGTIYVDATSYTRWVFLNLHEKRMDTASVYDSLLAAAPPFGWDLALHRYDVKTHGGSACVTGLGSVLQAAEDTAWRQQDFTADSVGKIVVDMSTMMEGYLGYTTSNVNPVLSQWLDVDTHMMPPVYTLSMRVYILRMSDGTCAALQFTNYVNESSQKGFVTIRYRYPVS